MACAYVYMDIDEYIYIYIYIYIYMYVCMYILYRRINHRNIIVNISSSILLKIEKNNIEILMI